jgi:hypothetical protein
VSGNACPETHGPPRSEERTAAENQEGGSGQPRNSRRHEIGFRNRFLGQFFTHLRSSCQAFFLPPALAARSLPAKFVIRFNSRQTALLNERLRKHHQLPGERIGHTMREVAKRAGVSPATVSRVLNKTHYISAETERRVLEVVGRLK